MVHSQVTAAAFSVDLDLPCHYLHESTDDKVHAVSGFLTTGEKWAPLRILPPPAPPPPPHRQKLPPEYPLRGVIQVIIQRRPQLHIFRPQRLIQHRAQTLADPAHCGGSGIPLPRRRSPLKQGRDLAQSRPKLFFAVHPVLRFYRIASIAKFATIFVL